MSMTFDGNWLGRGIPVRRVARELKIPETTLRCTLKGLQQTNDGEPG